MARTIHSIDLTDKYDNQKLIDEISNKFIRDLHKLTAD